MVIIKKKSNGYFWSLMGKKSFPTPVASIFNNFNFAYSTSSNSSMEKAYVEEPVLVNTFIVYYC